MASAAVAAVSYITGLTGTAAVVATTAAATVLGTVAATALLSQNPNQKSQGQLNSLNLTSNAPRLWQIGKRGNGGSLVDHFSYGHKNEYAELVIYLGEGPMGNITGIWSSGRKVWTGTLQHGQRVQLNEFDSPDGRAWVEYYDGRPGQTASSRLVSATGGQWASTAVGEGCAYVIVTCRWDPDTMPAIASFFFENEGAKIYDRRKDTTAGGSGSHRLTDPATWELSSNPAVALDHYLLGLRRNASAEPTFGVGLDPSLVNYTRFSTMANLCDEAVSVTVTPWYTGTQPRYEANGVIAASETYKDVILDLCRSMNARAADLGGEIAVIDNEVKTAVIDLTDYNVIDGTNESYVEKKSRDDLIGGVRGNYQNPDNNYNPADYPPYTDAQWAIDDGAVLEYDDFDLDYETDPERAQRLAKLHGLRLRRQATLSGVYDMAALILEDGDWFTRTTDKFPSGKTFEVIGSPQLDTATMSVTISAVEVDPNDTAWNAATDPAPVLQAAPATTTFPASLGLPNITVTPTTYTSPGGVSYPALEVRNLDYNDSIAEGLQIEVALDDGGGSPLPNAQIVIMPAGREYVTLAPLIPGTDYLIRSRRFENARVSGWSAWSPFTSLTQFVVNAIVNQGWGATASESAAANTHALLGAQSILDPFFQQYGDSNFWGVDGTMPNPQHSVLLTDDKVPYLRITGTATANNQYRRLRVPYRSTGLGQGLPCSAGERVALSAMLGLQNGTAAQVWVEFRNAAGGWVGGVNSAAASPGTGNSDRDSFTRAELIAVAPSGTKWAFFAVRGYANNGQSMDLRILEPMISKVPAGQVSAPPFALAPGATIGADVTLLNNALGIVNQGALATANEASRRRYETMPGVSIKKSVVTLDTVTINTDGGPVELEWDFEAYYDFATGGSMQGPNRIMVRVLRNGSTISDYREHCVIEASSRSTASNTMKHADLSSPGSSGSPVSTTYTLQAYQTDESGLGTIPSDLALIKVNNSKGAYLKATSYPADSNDL